MDLFGSGYLFATPTLDAFGNTVTNGTPTVFGIMQEVSIDISADTKELYGQQQFPVDLARGKIKIGGKVKFAGIFAKMLDTVFFQQGLNTGLLAIKTDTAGALIPTTPFQITPTIPNAGTFVQDLGVISPTGVPYVKVASAPTTGQYSVTAGVYLFATADTGKRVYINFEYSATTPTTAQQQSVQNLPMGATPFFGLNFTCQFAGKGLTIILPKCTSSKLSFGFKNEDFMVPELDFMAFYDPTSGTAIQWSTSE